LITKIFYRFFVILYDISHSHVKQAFRIKHGHVAIVPQWFLVATNDRAYALNNSTTYVNWVGGWLEDQSSMYLEFYKDEAYLPNLVTNAYLKHIFSASFQKLGIFLYIGQALFIIFFF